MAAINVHQEFKIEEHQLRQIQKPSNTGVGEDGYPVRSRDDIELIRLGKKPVMKRNFGFLSILGFSCTVLVSWEGLLTTFLQGFSNGGPSGVIWGFLFVWIGTFSVFLTISELASMAPTAGGQYHWVAMLAPDNCRRFLSYITGWLTFVAWQALTAGSGFFTGSTIQALVILCNPDYVPQPWHTMLFFWAVTFAAIFVNTIGGPALAKFEGAILVLHIAGFFAVLIPLVYLGPHGDASTVFSATLNEGMWPTQGVSFFVGLSGAIVAIIGADSAVHMSEEIKNAGVIVPRAIVISIVINGCLAFAMAIAIIFCLGSVDDVLAATETLIFPFVAIFLQATRSVAGTAAMSSIIVVMNFAGLVGAMASASRQLWSFSRDRAVPFWKIVSKLDRRTSIPTYSVLIAVTISILLSLIVLGSSTVFNDVVSLTGVGFYASYLIVCALLLWRRLTGAIAPYDEMAEVIGPGRLSWGRWKLPETFAIINNVFALMFLSVLFVFLCFPASAQVDPSTMNYAVLVFGATVIFSVIWYVLVAHRTYVGPLTEIKLEKA